MAFGSASQRSIQLSYGCTALGVTRVSHDAVQGYLRGLVVVTRRCLRLALIERANIGYCSNLSREEQGVS